MKSIKDAAAETGISEQNIRYYEKQGLIIPSRNSENSYREYSDENINRLKMIRLFRKLDMPVSQIRRLFDGEVTLGSAIHSQIRHLETEKNRMEDAIRFCEKISESQLSDLDADHYLIEMENEEKKGSVFSELIDDYKTVLRSEMKRSFSFMPDVRCDNPREFTDELLKFARQEGIDIVITKEGMSPRFEIDGVEYNAYRTSGRYGITVHCEMTHPEDYIPEGMSEKKYNRYRVISIIAVPLLLFIICNFWVFREALLSEPEGWFGLIIGIILFAADLAFIYYSYGKNFRG